MAHEAATYEAALTGKTPAETKTEVDAATAAARNSYQSSFEATEEQYQERADLEGAPVIDSIEPVQVEPEDTELTLTLVGEDLTGVTSVTLDGVAATEFTVNDDHEIEATFTVPAEDGSLPVVAHKGGLHGNTVAAVITIVPVIDTIDPTAFEAQEEDTELVLTLNGRALSTVTTVTLDGVESTDITVVSETDITATFPIPEEAGTLDVVAHKGELESNAVGLAFTIAA